MKLQEMNKEDLIDIKSLDIFPFMRVIWHSGDSKRIWGPKFENSKPLHHKSEYEMVRQGFRKCATMHFTNSSFDTYIERILEDGLFWLPIQRTKSYGGFAHKHYPTSADDPNSSVYGVLCSDIESGNKFREASGYFGNVESSDHGVIGGLLGFPECDYEFFNDVWLEGFFDPMWQHAVNADSVEMIGERTLKIKESIYNTQLLRYTGHRFNSHFPHSLSCKKSIEVGKNWEKVGNSLNSAAVKDLKDILRLPAKWTCLHGIAQIETPHFTVVTNSMPTKEKWTILFEASD